MAVIDSGDEDVLGHVSRGTRPSAALSDLTELPWFSLSFSLKIDEERSVPQEKKKCAKSDQNASVDYGSV